MIQVRGRVEALDNVAENVFVLTFLSPELAPQVLPGQFLNIRVDDLHDPLLRRPFSVYRVYGDFVEIVFNVVGRGTRILREKRSGDQVDILGPLGRPFQTGSEDFSTAILIGGGLGVAPLPLTLTAVERAGKRAVTFLGSRTAKQLLDQHLGDVLCATDDGSRGYHGTVVECLDNYLRHHDLERAKIFACGPTPMLRAVAELALRRDLPCEVSLEGAMACGFGICQGCPVELVEGERKYALMCKDGPTFDVRMIRI